MTSLCLSRPDCMHTRCRLARTHITQRAAKGLVSCDASLNTKLGPRGKRHLPFISAQVLFSNSCVLSAKRKLKHQTLLMMRSGLVFGGCSAWRAAVCFGWSVIGFQVQGKKKQKKNRSGYTHTQKKSFKSLACSEICAGSFKPLFFQTHLCSHKYLICQCLIILNIGKRLLLGTLDSFTA